MSPKRPWIGRWIHCSTGKSVGYTYVVCILQSAFVLKQSSSKSELFQRFRHSFWYFGDVNLLLITIDDNYHSLRYYYHDRDNVTIRSTVF